MMRRLLGRIFPGLLLLLVVTPTPPARAHEGHGHTIVGSLEPELLPDTSVWDHVIAAIYSLTDGITDPRHPEARTFIHGNLFLSDADAAVLLQEVGAARSRLQRLELRTDAEFEADQQMYGTPPRRQQIDEATLEARDQILRRLSPRGRKALLRWVAVIKQGMSHGPNR